MSRTGFILTILAVVAACGYGLLGTQGTGPAAKSPVGSPLFPAPSPGISLEKPDKSAIAKIEVWNLKPFTGIGNVPMPPLKDLFKPYYMIDKTGRFESIRRSDRQNDKWEFQGVLVAGGSLRVLFYNAAAPGKKLKILAPGDTVDGRLTVREIGKNRVLLRLTGEKKPQTFELKIFDSNRENYGYKRKTL